jgi:hypothetical protein
LDDSAFGEGEDQVGVGEIETSYLTTFGRYYFFNFSAHCLFISRVRAQATKTHFYILCETCVSRKWSAGVSANDSVVELIVSLKPPESEIFTALFENHHLNFGFLSDEEETYSFSVNAGGILNRHDFKETSYPDPTLPLWYGFRFTYELAPTSHQAANADLSDFVINESKKRHAEAELQGLAQKKVASASVGNL